MTPKNTPYEEIIATLLHKSPIEWQIMPSPKRTLWDNVTTEVDYEQPLSVALAEMTIGEPVIETMQWSPFQGRQSVDIATIFTFTSDGYDGIGEADVARILHEMNRSTPTDHYWHPIDLRTYSAYVKHPLTSRRRDVLWGTVSDKVVACSDGIAIDTTYNYSCFIREGNGFPIVRLAY